MKFLHTADLHIGRTLEMRSLLEDQKYILKQITEIAAAEKVDAVLISGDIFDRSVPREEAVVLYDDFISELVLEKKIRVFAISGNHDSSSRIQGMNSLLKKAGYYVEGNPQDPPSAYEFHDEYGSLNIVMLPFKDMRVMKAVYSIEEDLTPQEILKEVLKRADRADRNILMTHNYFSDSVNKAEVSDSERRLIIGGEDIIDREALSGFDYVALGHLHKPQKAGDENIRYSGSILKYSASETEHKKSVVIADLKEKGNTDIKLIPLEPLRDFVRLEGTLDELMRYDRYEKKDDFIAADITEPVYDKNPFALLSQLYPNLVSIKYPDSQNNNISYEGMNEEKIKDTYTLFREFYKSMNSEEMSEKDDAFLISILEETGNDSN